MQQGQKIEKTIGFSIEKALERQWNMGSAQRPIPLSLPAKEKKKLVQADVNIELWAAVQKEMKVRKVKVRQVVQWGLSNYLLATNPREAERLGISPDLK